MPREISHCFRCAEIDQEFVDLTFYLKSMSKHHCVYIDPNFNSFEMATGLSLMTSCFSSCLRDVLI